MASSHDCGLDAYLPRSTIDIDVKTDAVVNLEHEFESGTQVRHSLPLYTLLHLPFTYPS